MIVSGSWWDFVDVLATRHMGTLLQNHRNSIRPVILRWAVADDVWKRRTALLVQLKKQTFDRYWPIALCGGRIEERG